MHHYINRYTKFAGWQIWRVGVLFGVGGKQRFAV